MLKGKTVLLGVTGSIAAYKIAGLASMLKKQHADIAVLMTQNATNFINPITFETLTGNKCLIDTFDRNFQYSMSSAMPFAILPMTFALAGAMSTMSARFASATCSTLYWKLRSNVSMMHLLPVKVSNAER